MGSRWRAQISAALDTASTPIATWVCAAIGVLIAETTCRMSGKREIAQKEQHNQRDAHARDHAAQPEGKQIAHGPRT